MNNLMNAICFAALMSVGSLAQAASLGLATSGPVSSGGGGIFYDGFLLTDDFGINDIQLISGPLSGSLVSFSFEDDSSVDFLSIEDTGTDFYDIVAFGFTETGVGDSIEFQLGTGPGFANGALFTLTSDAFDFSTNDPFSFFDAEANSDGEYAAGVTVTLQGLEALTPIPLPATLPLVLAGMGGLFMVGSRRRTRS